MYIDKVKAHLVIDESMLLEEVQKLVERYHLEQKIEEYPHIYENDDPCITSKEIFETMTSLEPATSSFIIKFPVIFWDEKYIRSFFNKRTGIFNLGYELSSSLSKVTFSLDEYCITSASMEFISEQPFSLELHIPSESEFIIKATALWRAKLLLRDIREKAEPVFLPSIVNKEAI